MSVRHETITVETKRREETIDITARVEAAVTRAKIGDGVSARICHLNIHRDAMSHVELFLPFFFRTGFQDRVLGEGSGEGECNQESSAKTSRRPSIHPTEPHTPTILGVAEAVIERGRDDLLFNRTGQ